MAVRSAHRRKSPPASWAPFLEDTFVTVYPPVSFWEVGQIPAVEQALQRAESQEPFGLYVHLPFCRTKCDYCRCLSFIGQAAEAVDAYVEAVIEELKVYAAKPAVRGRPVGTVLFGGGTPSVLTAPQVQRLGDGLRSALPWDGAQEVTFECAPRSVRPDLLEMLAEMGVTRVSMGVQSFDDALLRRNGRFHFAEDVVRAFRWIREAGFGLVNLDLMIGLIGETGATWQSTVRRMIELEPESVTIYQAEIPGHSQLYRDLKSRRTSLAPVSREEKRARLDFAFGELDRAGYSVVNAYSAVRDPGRHRFQYQEHLWSGGDLIGLGAGSLGYINSVHLGNEVTLEGYQAEIRHGRLPVQRAFRLSDRDRLVRTFILQLKAGEVRTQAMREKSGGDVAEILREPLEWLEAQGRLTVSPDGVRLTESGLLEVDQLLPRFYDARFGGRRMA